MTPVPVEIRNRLIDALERAENPPTLWQVRAETRKTIERDLRFIVEDLRIIDTWVRGIEAVQMRQNSG